MDISSINQRTNLHQTSIASKPDCVELQVPLSISADMFIPDETGKLPIENYDIRLVPKNAVITSKDEISEIASNAAKEACPDGMTVKVEDSKAGKNVGISKNAISALAKGAGSLALLNLAAASGTAIAAPVAIAAGAVGAITSLDGLKDSFNLKGYYDGLKAQGITDVQVPVKQSDGTETTLEVPVDKLISNAKDSIITHSLNTVVNVFTVAAGMIGGPSGMLAITALALNVGAAVYCGRHAIKEFAHKAVQGIKNTAVNIAHKITGHEPESKKTEQSSSSA